MVPENRRQFWIVILAGVILVTSLGAYLRLGRITGYDPEIGQSGEAFSVGDVVVVATYGYSDDGDRLRFLVIRSWPATTPPNARLADPRWDMNSGLLPRVRHPDGVMRPVGTDGHVYFFVGDELRTMRVAMNEHTDTLGLARAGSLEGMWEYLQRFRVGD
jgi:hypothetical protein